MLQISEIPNHPGYFADSDGNLYSQWVNRGIHGLVRSSLLQRMKTSRSSRGGHMTIRFGRKGDTELVHRLIYRLFVGEIPEGLYICHKDGNPANNAVENLYAGTQKENMLDTVRHGTCALAKLTENQVKEILSLQGKMMIKDIAYKYRVNRHAITDIYRGRTWTYLTRKVAD